ncbi:MAG: EscU/YscU/HrcU family type III secretion system export apparatus switch protein [Spirochaetia bacterium]
MKKKKDKAVAVKYTPVYPAPFILAKGEGRLAARIKEIAKDSDIHIVEDPELGSRLFDLEIGNFIPEALYGVLARILAFVYETEGKQVK